MLRTLRTWTLRRRWFCAAEFDGVYRPKGTRVADGSVPLTTAMPHPAGSQPVSTTTPPSSTVSLRSLYDQARRLGAPLPLRDAMAGARQPGGGPHDQGRRRPKTSARARQASKRRALVFGCGRLETL
eukprot:scaffold104439_cov53-Phaeocystis_antarctica.AAC.2